jgi:Domain of Unknown Function with PDB structure (DUF3857)/Transglutaminase-like superfamily
MNRTTGHRLLGISLSALTLLFAAPVARAADQCADPTPEELHMTSQPEVPGATAVVLNREEFTEDKNHMFSIHTRLKVLTEGGKEYGDVELEYSAGHAGYSVTEISGCTIHPDGTKIPFTGKPYDKLIEKTQDYQYKAKVFTMPDVQVGSIIDYRYKLRYDDNFFLAPRWLIQTKLYTRKADFVWKPTSETLLSKGKGNREQLTNSIAWFPILPAGAEVKQARLPSSEMMGPGQLTLETHVHDVPPIPNEEFMPPIGSLSYRVLFYYTAYLSGDEFWKEEGKHWSKDQDKFIGPGPAVGAAVRDLTAPSDTQDQKLHKLYAAVMKLENTDYTRQHSATEDKSQGLGEVKNTDDVWNRKRGTGDQLADLFIAMARASGMKAYAMTVTNRDRSVFANGYLSLSQLDDNLAVVVVDGKEKFFDPGTRYCSYGHLAWKHTMARGLRQTDGGVTISDSPFEPYSAASETRVANLKMDEHGVVTGTVEMKYVGPAALRWRSLSLTGDASDLDRGLRVHLENMLPTGTEVKVAAIDKIDSYDEPLTVHYTVKGPIGSSTGKRLLVPSDVFVMNAKPTFPHEKREVPVYFEYPHSVLDAVRITFPPSFSIESLPAAAQETLPQVSVYSMKSESTPNTFTIRRSFVLGDILVAPKDYPQLRSYYGKFETKDQESVVLKVGSTDAAKPAPSGN